MRTKLSRVKSWCQPREPRLPAPRIPVPPLLPPPPSPPSDTPRLVQHENVNTSIEPTVDTSIQPAVNTSIQPTVDTPIQPATVNTSIQPTVDTSVQPTVDTSTQTTAGSDFQKEVFDALECPVCREIATPPVTLCKLGHFICGICRKKVDRCVICREEYTDQRCYVVEKIASNVSVKCHCKPCEMTVNIGKLMEHLESCDYRPVICNSKCKSVCVNKPIQLDNYVNHLQEVHGAKPAHCIYFPEHLTKMIKEGGQRINCGTWLFTHDGVTFILNGVIEGALAYFWVSAVLPGSQASRYMADILLGQKDIAGKVIKRDTKCIKWRVGVVPVHATMEEMKRSSDCMAFPESRMISLSGKNPDECQSFTICIELALLKI